MKDRKNPVSTESCISSQLPGRNSNGQKSPVAAVSNEVSSSENCLDASPHDRTIITSGMRPIRKLDVDNQNEVKGDLGFNENSSHLGDTQKRKRSSSFNDVSVASSEEKTAVKERKRSKVDLETLDQNCDATGANSELKSESSEKANMIGIRHKSANSGSGDAAIPSDETEGTVSSIQAFESDMKAVSNCKVNIPPDSPVKITDFKNRPAVKLERQSVPKYFSIFGCDKKKPMTLADVKRYTHPVSDFIEALFQVRCHLGDCFNTWNNAFRRYFL